MPTITSLSPHSNMRPSMSSKLPRTFVAWACTPRSGTFASVPVVRIGRLIITNNSGEARALLSSRRMPGASAMIRTSSPPRPLIISDSAPLRSTIAFSSPTELSMVLTTPWAMDNTPTITATTPAIPNMAAADEPLRCGRERMPNWITAKIWVIQLNTRHLLSASAICNFCACSAGIIPAINAMAKINRAPRTRSRVGR